MSMKMKAMVMIMIKIVLQKEITNNNMDRKNITAIKIPNSKE